MKVLRLEDAVFMLPRALQPDHPFGLYAAQQQKKPAPVEIEEMVILKPVMGHQNAYIQSYQVEDRAFMVRQVSRS